MGLGICMQWAFEDPWGGSAGESGCALEAFAGDEQSFKGGHFGMFDRRQTVYGCEYFPRQTLKISSSRRERGFERVRGWVEGGQPVEVCGRPCGPSRSLSRRLCQ